MDVAWTNGGAYTAIQLWRDNMLRVILPGDAVSAVDAPVPAGDHQYCVVPLVDGVPLLPACCVLAVAACPAVAPPRILICETGVCEMVRLLWENADACDAVEVTRNGTKIADLPGTATTFTDEESPVEGHRYCVVALSGGVRSYPACCFVEVEECPPGIRFVRGDTNTDGEPDIGDAINILSFLFAQEAPPPCLDAADANDDEEVDIGDAVFLLSFLFAEGPDPLAPYPVCGLDPASAVENIDCERYAPCE